MRVRPPCDPCTNTSPSDKAGGIALFLPLTDSQQEVHHLTHSVNPAVPPSGTGCAECLESGGLVVTPTTVCGVRPHRMLRQLARPARDCARQLVRSPCHPQLRTRRGLVLELPNQRVHGRASPRTPAASSRRPTRAWTSRTGPRKLARPLGGVMTMQWVATSSGAVPCQNEISPEAESARSSYHGVVRVIPDEPKGC